MSPYISILGHENLSDEDYMKTLQEYLDKQQQKSRQEKAAIVSINSPEIMRIYSYYIDRKLRWPTLDEALQWANSESGEVSEQLLARQPGWVRNNPEKHPEFSEEKLFEEIADQVFMLLIAGMVEGYDILDIMQKKMQRKLEELNLSS